MKWKQWHIDAAGVAVLALLSGGAYCLQVAPALRQKELHAAQSAELAAQRARNAELAGMAKGLEGRLSAAHGFVEKNQLKLEPASALNQKLARLTDLAAEQGLQVDGIEPGASSSGKRYGTIKIKLSGRGSYEGCGRFLRTLREKLPECGVREMQLNGQPGAVQTAGTFELALVWYTRGTNER